MKVLLTGATGFTGSHLLPMLLERGLNVRCLLRGGSDVSRVPAGKVEAVVGDLGDKTSLERAMEGIDTLVNIASLGFGHAPNIVSAAVEQNVQRAVFVSTTAIFTSLNAPSKTVRLAAEETIQSSGLRYTILRPTMIYGTSADRNICRLIRYLRRWPVIPVFGSGECLQQPVYVQDVATAVVQALEAPASIQKCYNISGGAPLTYNCLIETICRALGRFVMKLHLPAEPIIAALELFQRLGLPIPIKAEQVRRLNENKAFDFAEAARDFGYRPRPFDEGVRLQLRQMNLIP